MNGFDLVARIPSVTKDSMGMALYLHEDTHHTVKDITTWKSSGGMIEVIQYCIEDIRINSVYCQPKAAKSEFDELIKFSANVSVIMGDLNINSRDAQGSGKKTLEVFSSASSKVSILDEATHQLGGQPDHILVDVNFHLPT